MAGDWIKVRMSLHDDPAVISLAARQGINEDEVVGILVRVWSWFDTHTTDGNAVGVTTSWLDRYAGRVSWSQDMIAIGWLVVENGGIRMPHFDRHNSQAAKLRALTSNRVSRSRNAKSVTSVTHGALPEKRREEKRIRDNASALSPAVGEEPTNFPASGKRSDGETSPPSPEGIAEKPSDERSTAAGINGTPKADRRSCAIWDVVAQIWFAGKVITSQRTRCGKAVRDFKELDADAQQIADRWERMRKEWGDSGATPESLIKHWYQFGPDRKVGSGAGSLFGAASAEAQSPARIKAKPGKYDNLKVVRPPEFTGTDGGCGSS